MEHAMTRLSGLVLAPILLVFLGGCSQYVEDYNFMPHPALAEIGPPQAQGQPAPGQTAQQPPPVSVLASIVGVRRADSKQNLPESVEVCLRVENNGPGPITFDPRSLALLDGHLVQFPPPVVRPPQSITLAPMQGAIIGAFFPFAPGHSYQDTDLSSLELRWAVDMGGQGVAQAVDFRRVVWGYYDPYWDYPVYPYGFYGGVVIVHRR
jgi:hypothetical protein